ncbi:Est1p PWA37_000887 [Arxiozyma heterogenica]
MMISSKRNNNNSNISEQLKKFIFTLDYELNSVLYNNEFLNIRLKEQHTVLRDQILEQISGLSISSNKSCINEHIEPILPIIWNRYQSLCIEWFYKWKQLLKETSNISAKGRSHNNRKGNITVEFRIMKSKLSKLMKIFHRFYYQILEYIICYFDTSLVISTQVTSGLNLGNHIQKLSHLAKNRYLLQTTDKGTVHVVLSFYYCLLYLGKIRYHQTILEDPLHIKYKRNKHVELLKTNDIFQKAKRYWIMATIVVPSMDESYKQLSKVFLHCNNYSKAIFYHVRCYFARSNSSKANSYNDIIDFFKERYWRRENRQFEKMDNIEYDLVSSTMEIIRYYLLLNNSKFNQTNNSIDENGEILELKSNILLKLQDPQVFMYHEFWIDIIITMIGISTLIMENSNANDKKSLSAVSSFVHWNERIHKLFIRFVFDILFHIITYINKMISYDEIDINRIDPFLTILRVMNCWIKSHIPVLRFAHRYLPICHIISEFINQINKSSRYSWISYKNEKPKRSYLFMDDVLLRDFTCIGYSLTDFNDTEVFHMDNFINRLTGNAPRTCLLSKEQETELKLIAIVTSMKRFLHHNKCGTTIKLQEEETVKEKTKNNYW